MSKKGANYGSDMFERGKGNNNYTYTEKRVMSLKFGEENKKDYFTGQSKNTSYNNNYGSSSGSKYSKS